MNLDRINEELAKLEGYRSKSTTGERTGFSKYKWMPSAGENVIRILPNPFDEEFPFQKLEFYYLDGKTFLAPCLYGEPDPVHEMWKVFMPKPINGQKLELEEWKKLKEVHNKMEPQPAYFVPVLVRGLEHEGVKYYKFSKKAFQDLVAIMTDKDYGNIIDLKYGRDIKVTYTPAKSDGDSRRANTVFLAKPNQTPASDDLVALEKALTELPAVQTFYKLAPVSELQEALDKFLKVPTVTEPSTKSANSTKPVTTTSPESDAVNKLNMDFADLLASVKPKS